MVTKKFVKYVDNSPITQFVPGLTGSSPTNITLNKEYELIGSKRGDDGTNMYIITNDRGKAANYNVDRFEKPVLKKMMARHLKMPLLPVEYHTVTRAHIKGIDTILSEDNVNLTRNDIYYAYNIDTKRYGSGTIHELRGDWKSKGWKIFFLSNNRERYITALNTNVEVMATSSIQIPQVAFAGTAIMYAINDSDIIFTWEPIFEDKDTKSIVIKGGSAVLRKALFEELMSLGYNPHSAKTVEYAARSFISNNITIYSDKQFSSTAGTAATDTKYTLPADYDNILEAAKDMLKPKCIKHVVGSNNLEIEIYPTKITTKYGEIDITKFQNLVSYFESKLNEATANLKVDYKDYGVRLSIEPDDRIIRIGCATDNNLFSLNEMKMVISECRNIGK